MIEGQSVLAVIPARGGSKRFPGKNIAPFRGRPLIVWTILAAQKSKYIDTLTCSTDDDDIGVVSLVHECGVLRRPAELATDSAKTEDVARHVIAAFPLHDWTVILQPTSPLRTTEDMDNCIVLALNQDGCVSKNDETHLKNGAVYVMRSRLLAAGRNFDKPFTNFYTMPASRSLDIDYAKDMEPHDFLPSDRPA